MIKAAAAFEFIEQSAKLLFLCPRMTHFGLTDEITPTVVQLAQSIRMGDTVVNFNFKLEA